MEIDFEIEKIIEKIKEGDYKEILIQLPDGLKPYAKYIYDKIRENFDGEIYIWLESDYGGCDIPVWLKEYGIDLIVHFGHTQYYKLRYE